MTVAGSDSAADEVLADLELLRLMPGEVRQLVAACFVPKQFATGEPIVRQGERADAYYVVIAGRVRVVAAGDGDEEVPLVDLGRGDGFGEMGLLREDVRRTATV